MQLLNAGVYFPYFQLKARSCFENKTKNEILYSIYSYFCSVAKATCLW